MIKYRSDLILMRCNVGYVCRAPGPTLPLLTESRIRVYHVGLGARPTSSFRTKMFYDQTPQTTRQFFFDAWEKYRHQQPLSALEQEIAAVILLHPEYHSLFESKASFQESCQLEFNENNPFLHMGLHLAIREQIATDRPMGIKRLAQKLLQKCQDPSMAEHLMMECLAESLWLAQKNKQAPDEVRYLQTLATLL